MEATSYGSPMWFFEVTGPQCSSMVTLFLKLKYDLLPSTVFFKLHVCCVLLFLLKWGTKTLVLCVKRGSAPLKHPEMPRSY